MTTDTPSETTAAEPPPAVPAAPSDAPPPAAPPAAEQPNTQLLLLKDKVQRYLADLVGSVQLTPDGAFTFQLGSTRVFVICQARTPEMTTVKIVAPVLIGCAASPELFEHIALHADDYMFGHLSAERAEDGTIGVYFTHILLGDFLDPEELKGAVGRVATTADEIDDELKTRFGGRRFHDDVA
jgi:hypothetical protein